MKTSRFRQAEKQHLIRQAEKQHLIRQESESKNRIEKSTQRIESKNPINESNTIDTCNKQSQ